MAIANQSIQLQNKDQFGNPIAQLTANKQSYKLRFRKSKSLQSDFIKRVSTWLETGDWWIGVHDARAQTNRRTTSSSSTASWWCTSCKGICEIDNAEDASSMINQRRYCWSKSVTHRLKANNLNYSNWILGDGGLICILDTMHKVRQVRYG